MSMSSPEQELDRLVSSAFEAAVPQSIDIWVPAEKLARIYKITGRPDVSQRYFRMAAHSKEQQLMVFRMREGKTAFIAHRAHAGLLYRYAGDMGKAQSLFEQAAVEASTALYAPLINEDRHSLLETLLFTNVITGDYADASRHLNALKDVCASLPGLFRPVHRAIEAALQEGSDSSQVDQAIDGLQNFIDQRQIAPYAAERISEWDILECLTAMANAPQSASSEKAQAALLDANSDAPARAAGLSRLLEYDLPTFGLGWPLAERIARLYKSLGDSQAAQSYFERAAQMAEAQITELAPHYHKYHKDLALVECSGHAAWLYHWASDQEKKHALADSAIGRAEAGLPKYRVSIDVRFSLLESLIHLHLLKGNVQAAWQHVSEMKELLATIGNERARPSPSAWLETLTVFIGAKTLNDQELARRAITHLEKQVEAADLPIDITGCVAGRDLLEVLRGLG
jgi:tetratricopeptide (TPR) repeat protein